MCVYIYIYIYTEWPKKYNIFGINLKEISTSLKFIPKLLMSKKCIHFLGHSVYTRVGTLIVATIYLQLIQNRYMFRSFTVLQCSHSIVYNPLPAMWKS